MDTHDGPKSDPIAIVGMACRLPGDVDSPSSLWKLLEEERSGQCDVPESRFNIDAFYEPGSSEVPGGMNMKGGYFIKEDIREFDNEFFGILNAEATYMDPQQRKLLEVVFESFESAGVSLDQVSGSDTGCYVCSFSSDYIVMQTKDPEYMDRYSATGMGATILGNRISHTFNMLGPSQVIDTACSSSLYCLNSACAALESRDCNAAVVAGANLIQSIEQHLGMMKAGVLSPTSTCHTFSDEADGYARADGVGSIYLKRLSDAIRDNDPIRAVIRGTAVGSNGKTRGISAPSADAQEAVIRKAYQKAGINPSDTAYMECHGTGTPAGDPIEVEAISRVFKRNAQNPLLIGSVKTNVGHGEAVSGLSGIIKTVLALEKGQIPPTIGVKRINPKIKTTEWGVEIVTKIRDWPDRAGASPRGVRRAGINSFGYGGANGHVILEAVPSSVQFERVLTPFTAGSEQTLSEDLDKVNSSARFGALSSRIKSANTLESGDTSSTEESDSISTGATDDSGSTQASDISLRNTFLLPFSASNVAGLEARISALHGLQPQTMDIVDLAYTLGCRRTHFTERAFVVARRGTLRDDLKVDRLRTLLNVKADGNSPSEFAFVFTGQGAQWPGMGKELFEEFSVFRQSIREMDAVLRMIPHPPEWTIEGTLFETAETSEIHNASCAQPMATALQVATVELLASWNVRPKRVVGHSSGEVAGAFAAGYISSTEAIIAAYYRGYLNGVNKLEGAMMAVGLGSQEAEAEICQAALCGKVGVACVNSPVSVTMSGDADAVTTLSKDLQGRGIFARKLNTGGKAYHSHHMAVLGPELERLLPLALKQLPPSECISNDVEFISSVTGQPKTTGFDATYWRTNMESPVLFSQAVQCLIKKGDVHLIEIGPHSALELPLKQIRKEMNITEKRTPYSSSLTRGQDAAECSLNLLGRLFLHGQPVDFRTINTQDVTISPRVMPDLPPYPRTYDSILWSEPRVSREVRHRKDRHHELLGSQVPGGDGLTKSWRNMLQIKHVSWLESHKLEQTIIFPGAGYIAMAIEAVSQTLDGSRQSSNTFGLRNVNILAALVLPPETETEIFTTLRPKPLSSATKSKEWWDFEIVSYTDGYSSLHATGSISLQTTENSLQSMGLSPDNDSELEKTASKGWYNKLGEAGLNFGPDFQSIKEVQKDGSRSYRYAKTLVPFLQTSARIPEHEPSYTIHPITIDALLQSGIIAAAGSPPNVQARMPVSIESATFRGGSPENSPEELCSIQAVASVVGFGAIEIGAELQGTTGHISAQMKKVRMAPYTPATRQEATRRQPMNRIVWKPDLYGSCWTSHAFSKHLDGVLSSDASSSSSSDEQRVIFAHILSLLNHKNAKLRVLELWDKNAEISGIVLDGADFSHLIRSFTAGYLSSDGQLFGTQVEIQSTPAEISRSATQISDQSYDLIVLPNVVSSDLYLHAMLPNLKDLLTDDGFFVAATPLSQTYGFEQNGFSTVHKDLPESRISLGRSIPNLETYENPAIIVECDNAGRPAQTLADNLLNILDLSTANRVKFSEVSQDNIPPGAIIYSTLEVEHPLLSSLVEDDMARLKILTNRASKIAWATGGGFLSGAHPDFALVSGLARALMIEQPSLVFCTLDLEQTELESSGTARNIYSILHQPGTGAVPTDYEFIQRGSLVHISRFVPDEDLNQSFRQRQGNETMSMSLAEAKPSRLNIGSLGQFDTINFKKEPLKPADLEPGFVQVEVQAVGLNAKGCAVLSGKHETRDGACTIEHCGIVTRVADNVVDVAPGDRVVVMAPGHFRTHEIVPQWACCKLHDGENFAICCTLPAIFSNALYALQHRAQIQPGETVLIHSGNTEVGNAAIQIAKLADVKIYTTASTEVQKSFLINKFHLTAANVLNTQDFYKAIMTATNGRGVDVVLNSLSGDLLHDSWNVCAPFGRFIELGNRDLVDSGKLDMGVFKRGATFTALDMGSLFYDDHSAAKETWARLLAEVMKLYRKGTIQPVEPIETFDVSQIPHALRRFAAEERMGKVAISFENPISILQVHPPKYHVSLDVQKTYVLVGCLGGLGRSISKWMMARGARKFLFLGRSGLDKQTARALVQELETAGADVKVVRGDVSEFGDVQKAVDGAESPIGGVIHAAMGLSEALFTKMSNKSWHTGVDPKLQGCWNLHNAIKGKDNDLDFFFMTSSVSGSIGQAAQANYCAANYALDMFARHRRSMGLPATAVGFGMISEVGYLHENPDIEAILSRSGITALDEDELLQILDIALSQPPDSQSHILTGMESTDVDSFPAKSDPRTSLLLARLEQAASVPTSEEDNGETPAEDANSNSKEATTARIRKQFAKLLSVQHEKVDTAKNLAAYGMDSMMGTEFRTWLFQTFKVDVPFFEFLDAGTTIESLSKKVLSAA